jgi:hypothetical protein
MKRLALLGVLILSFACAAVADQINFNFTLGVPGSVTATAAAGLASGPSDLQNISDSTKMTVVPFLGTYVNGNTGPATSLNQIGAILIATFSGSGANSVLVVDSSNNVLVSGSMNNDASLLSTLAVGTGSFLGTFDVSFVSPAALALFGLGPSFLPNGSVAFTLGNASFDGTTFTAAIGGGSVTIETPTVPEPAGLGILGVGVLTLAGGLRRAMTSRWA